MKQPGNATTGASTTTSQQVITTTVGVTPRTTILPQIALGAAMDLNLNSSLYDSHIVEHVPEDAEALDRRRLLIR